MVETVYIRVADPSTSQFEWIAINDDGNITQAPKISDIEQILKQIDYQPIVFFVPGLSVTVTSVKLPPASRHRMLQALPFALEETIAEDIEKLHFALGDNKGSDNTDKENKAVAITTKSNMDHWVANYKKPNVYCKAMLPEFLALPYLEDTWSIIIDKQVASVRTGKLTGFSCEVENLVIFLKSAIESNHSESPKDINIYSYASEPMLDIQKLELLGANVTVKKPEIQLITLLSLNYSSALSLNLLQGNYRQKQKITANKSMWKMAGIMFGLLVILSVVDDVYEYFSFKNQQEKLNQQVTTTYKQIFPQATSVVSPKIRVERQLRNLALNQSGGGFLGLLVRSGNIIKNISGTAVKSVIFQNNQLSMNIETKTFDSLEELKLKLSNSGLSITVDNATSKDNVVSARLTIKG